MAQFSEMIKLVILFATLGAISAFPGNQVVPDGRIIGGHEADISEYPWTLALLLNYQHYCGAVLIDPEWVVTTAHCVDHGIREGLSVRAGSSLRNFGGVVVDIFTVVIHPYYDPETVDFDFAIARLAAPVTIETAKPIKLPISSIPIEDGVIAHISGWGTLDNDGPAAEALHAATIPVVSRADCERHYGEKLTLSMFCAGRGDIDACRGDSGGPIVIDDHLAGLISWGPTICGTPGLPGVYADVGHVTLWFEEIMKYGGAGAS